MMISFEGYKRKYLEGKTESQIWEFEDMWNYQLKKSELENKEMLKVIVDLYSALAQANSLLHKFNSKQYKSANAKMKERMNEVSPITLHYKYITKAEKLTK